MKQATKQEPLLRIGSANRQQEDTTIMGSDVSYAVRADML
jgi:hypothetical protein